MPSILQVDKIQTTTGGPVAIGSANVLIKADPYSPVFTRTGAATLQIKTDTHATVGGIMKSFSTPTTVEMPALVAGTDYSIYLCADGVLRASDNHSTLTTFAGISRKIGGFHFDLGSSILASSIWDDKFRPQAPNPRGMFLLPDLCWVDIYLLGRDHHINGTSKAGVKIADGENAASFPRVPGQRLTGTSLTACRVATTANITLSAPQTIDGVAVVAGNRVLVKDQSTASQNGVYLVAAGAWTRATDANTGAKIPFGIAIPISEGTVGTGQTFYHVTDPGYQFAVEVGTTPLAFTLGYHNNCHWWTVVGVLAAHGKELLSGNEYCLASSGITEGISTTTDQVNTGRFVGLTSKLGMEQAAGAMNVWGSDGLIPQADAVQIYGGSWNSGISAGSRSANNLNPSLFYDSVGARGRCDHLILV